ncbi:B-4DMT family transporter [Nocardia halotolerans]|uniref:B-4DMT family transporter n=1 Tax=Nocardia halotolerans TaxID=1755878 RepID=A0ABV8VDI9_9NOCA
MTVWVLRAAVLGALVVGLRVLLGFAMASAPTYGTLWRTACLVAIVAVALAWGARDARAVAGGDLTVRWLSAGLVAGLSSGAVCWALDQLPGVELGGSGALFELTSAASFVTLLIFLPAMAGVGYRRMRSRRSPETAPVTSEPELVAAR